MNPLRAHAPSAADATRERAESKLDVWAATLPPVVGSPVVYGNYSGCIIKKVVNAQDHVVLVRVPGLGDREAKRGQWQYRDVSQAVERARSSSAVSTGQNPCYGRFCTVITAPCALCIACFATCFGF